MKVQDICITLFVLIIITIIIWFYLNNYTVDINVKKNWF